MLNSTEKGPFWLYEAQPAHLNSVTIPTNEWHIHCKIGQNQTQKPIKINQGLHLQEKEIKSYQKFIC